MFIVNSAVWICIWHETFINIRAEPDPTYMRNSALENPGLHFIFTAV